MYFLRMLIECGSLVFVGYLNGLEVVGIQYVTFGSEEWILIVIVPKPYQMSHLFELNTSGRLHIAFGTRLEKLSNEIRKKGARGRKYFRVRCENM
jgi:hypothetical protein